MTKADNKVETPQPVQTGCHPLPAEGSPALNYLVRSDICDQKHGELGRAMFHMEKNNDEAHTRIEAQLKESVEQQTKFMDQMRNSILGNGKPGLELRVAMLEKSAQDKRSWVFLFLKPLLPIAYSILLAALILYLNKG